MFFNLAKLRGFLFSIFNIQIIDNQLVNIQWIFMYENHIFVGKIINMY